MAWTETTRAQYRRDHLRYASDLTDPEWAVIAPLVSGSRLGRPPLHDRRTILDAIFFVLATGCQWRALPKDCPPRSTVQSYFYRWRDDGTWRWINAKLVLRARLKFSRGRIPSAGIIDSQSVKTGGEAREMVGYDAGKRVKGRKRHLVTDTLGLM